MIFTEAKLFFTYATHQQKHFKTKVLNSSGELKWKRTKLSELSNKNMEVSWKRIRKKKIFPKKKSIKYKTEELVWKVKEQE